MGPHGKQVKRSNRILIAGIVLVCVCKLILVESLCIVAIPEGMEDDRLFVDLAVSILNGEWLGHYNHMTLSKGPFFPLFLAANFLLGLPLKFTEQLLYLVSGIVLLYALSGTIKNRVLLLVLFVVYAFNPAAASVASLRVLREGIYPSLTVLVFAGMIGMALSSEQPTKRLVKWSLLTGIALSAFWLTREEGAWIIPSIFISIAVSVRQAYRRRGEAPIFSRLFVTAFLPWMICVLGLGVVASINKVKYDIFATNEIKNEPFASAYAAFLRVDHSEPIIVPAGWKARVAVPRSVRDAVAGVSPSFRDIQFDKVGNVWVEMSCRNAKEPCDDMSGGVFLWALRQAVQKAGYYEDSKKAADYYRKLTNEVNAACDEKRLKCGPKRSSLVPPLRPEHLQEIPSIFLRGVLMVSTFGGAHTGLYPSAPGSPEGMALFRNLSRGIVSLPAIHEKQVRIRGWVFQPGGEAVDVKVLSDSRNTFVERQAGEDVVRHFKDPAARNARFHIDAKYYDECRLVFSIKGRILAEASLHERPESFRPFATFNERPLSFKIYDSKTLFVIDESIEVNPNPLMALNKLTDLRIDILNRIAVTYSEYYRYFGMIALLFYSYALFLFIRRKTTPLFFINSSLLLAIITRLLLVTVVHVTSFHAMHLLYLSCIHPLMLVFTFLAVADGILYLKHNPLNVSA